MDDRFEMASGSVVGRTHLRELAWSNNQDAAAWAVTRSAIAAVVCDGCGAEPHSELGARLGARLTLASVLERVGRGEDVVSPCFWDGVAAQVLGRIASLAGAMGTPWRRVIHEHFLFTVCGAVVTESMTALFSLGDGVMFLNGDLLPVERFTDNAPPYLAYRLVDGFAFDDEALRIRVRAARSTRTVDSILVGTDGVTDLIADPRQALISQFWSDDACFDNPRTITRRLALLNRQHRTVDREAGTVTTGGGQLPDDTTLVVIRRGRVPAGEPERPRC